MYSHTMATSQMGGCNLFFFFFSLLGCCHGRNISRAPSQGGRWRKEEVAVREKAGCHRRREKAAGSRAITLHCFQLEEISRGLASKPDVL